MDKHSPRKKRATIKMVAQEAGVSTQTVSRVINDRPDVAPETRQRVKEAILLLDYHPSAVARSLIQQRSYTLGVVMTGMNFFGPANILNGISQQAETMGYALLLDDRPRYRLDDHDMIVQSLLARQVDGILWGITELVENNNQVWDKIFEIPVPVVFLGEAPGENTIKITIDNFSGGQQAAQHLIDQGRQHIAHIAGPLNFVGAQPRLDGWKSVLNEAGFVISDRQWLEGDWTAEGGEFAFNKLVSQYPEMDAAFIANDQMALGFIHAAVSTGRRIPEDIAIVGFDGMPEAAYFCPPLTTVVQDLNKLGRLGVETLVNCIRSRKQEPITSEIRSTSLQPELLIRESSGSNCLEKSSDHI